MSTKPNDFRAVAWVRQVRDQNYELTKAMTPEERVAFYREASKRFHARLASLGLDVPSVQHSSHPTLPASAS